MSQMLQVAKRTNQKHALQHDLQATFWGGVDDVENSRYLTDQLITCIGNKRSLLPQLGGVVEMVKKRVNKGKIGFFDAFAGSGVVSRFMKQHCHLVISNDIEPYAAAAGRCYLTNKSTINKKSIESIVEELNALASTQRITDGFIREMYAPRDEHNIKADDRVFYSISNAQLIDTYRQLLNKLDKQTSTLMLGSLLSEASIHANTAGVFKGFYKDSATGIGKFGGSGADALSRILGPISLHAPTLSQFECDVVVCQENANELAPSLPELDLAYIDPPYNQHPYGSNYFMLNLILDYQRPAEVSRVSGIPTDWRRSQYNVRKQCLPELEDLAVNIDAKFLLISYNNEGFISPEDMEIMLSRIGKVQKIDIHYNAFRGSRSFAKRSIHVIEHMFVVEK